MVSANPRLQVAVGLPHEPCELYIAQVDCQGEGDFRWLIIDKWRSKPKNRWPAGNPKIWHNSQFTLGLTRAAMRCCLAAFRAGDAVRKVPGEPAIKIRQEGRQMYDGGC